MKKILNLLNNFISIKSVLTAIFFGLVSMFTVLAGIHVYLPGSVSTTDPREIFNSIGSALTGPIGGIIISAISTLFAAPPEYKTYIFFTHFISAIWIGWAYKKLIYDKYEMPMLAFGWIVLMIIYYLLSTEILIIASYFFIPSLYTELVGRQAPFIQSSLKYLYDYIPEFFFSTAISSLIIIALPFKFRKPLWGQLSDKNKIPNKKQNKKDSNNKLFKKNFLAVRLAIWFLILFSIPTIYLSVYVRNYFQDFILNEEGKKQYEFAVQEAHLLKALPEDSIRYFKHEILKNNIRNIFVLDKDLNFNPKVNINDERNLPPIILSEANKIVISQQKSGFFTDIKLSIAVGFAQINNNGSYIISISDSKNSNAQINQFVYNIIKYIGITLLLIALISGIIIWYLVGIPLKKITHAALEIGNHNYNVKIDSSDMTDEVIVLADSINTMKENIKGAEEMLSNILNSVPQSIFWKDKNCVYLGCNKIFAKSAGFDNPSQIIGKTDYQMPWKKEESDSYISDDKEVISTGLPKYHIIEKFTDVNGNLLWVDTTKIPLRNSENNIYGVLGVFEDITERKNAEEALLANEIKYRTLFENANDAIFLMDYDVIIDCNTKSLEVFGCNVKEQIIGHTPFDFSPKIQPDKKKSRESALEKVNAVLNGQPQFFEWQHVKQNGELFFAEISLNKMEIESKVLLQAIVRDITERKKLENELTQSRANLSALFESATDLIWSVDKNFNLLTYNKRLEEHFQKNYGTKAFIGAPSGSLLSSDRSKIWPPLYQRAIDEGPFQTEYSLPDGRIFEMAIHPVIINNEITGVSVFGKEITERKQAEDALRKSESYYRAFAENSPDIIAVFDRDGRYEFVNSSISKVSNLKPENFVGKRIFEIDGFNKEQAEFREKKIKEVFITRQPFELEFEFNSPAGPRIFEWRVYPVIDETGFVQSVYSINRDITERKAIEKEILDNKAFTERIIEQSPDIIYIYDVELDKNIFTNRNIAKYLGYSEEELSSEDQNFFKKVLHPDDIAQFRSYYEKIVQWENEYVFEFEYRMKTKAGEWRWFRGKEKEFQRNEQGRIISLVGTVRDITENKKSEEELRNSEQRFKVLTEATFEGIVIATDRKFVDVNDQMLNIFGYSRENIIGKNTIDFIAPESRDKFIANRDNLDIGPLEFIGIKSDGSRIPFEIRAKHMVINNKEYRISSIRDITDRLKTEMALKEAMNEIELLINTLPIAIISVNRDLTVKQYNDKALIFDGAINRDYQSKQIFDLFPKLIFIKDTLEKSIAEDKYINEDKIALEQYGEPRTFNLTIIPLNNPLNSGSVIMLEEITERRKIESLMIQSEKMLSVAGLAAGMAHEINNPLGTIVQGCQNIIRRTSTELPKNIDVAKSLNIDMSALESYFKQRQIYDILDSMRHAVEKASDIIKNMLQFSRKSESKKVLYPMSKLVEETLDLAYNDYDLKKKYDFRSIRIIKDFQDELPLVRITITEIQQVILNILRNASHAFKSKFYKNNEPTIKIILRKEGRFIILEIEDNGPGIDEKIKQRIFEPFFTTKEVGEGTGLGLSVSYMIITNNHQGTITVESVKGMGAKFIIKLPL